MQRVKHKGCMFFLPVMKNEFESVTQEVYTMNPLKYYRIFDEEPCPCGSGMKYSLCCKKREDSFQRDNKRPVEVQAAEILKNLSINVACIQINLGA